MSMQSHSHDAEARQRIRGSLDESLIVEAAAGTGKTSELVRRLVAVLGSGRTTVDRIVAVTFTRKAAGELKLRVRQELDRARTATQSPEESAALEQALAHLEEARTGTIHSFCADLLRERPVEARVDPGFEELSEPGAHHLYSQAFRSWLERKLAEASLPLRRVFSRLMGRGSAERRSPAEQLRSAAWKVIEWRDFEAACRRPPFHLETEVDMLAARVLELADLSARCTKQNDNLFVALQPVRHLAMAIRRAEQVAGRDHVALEDSFARLLVDLKKNQRKGSGAFAPGVDRREVLDLRERLGAALEDFDRRAGADLAAALLALSRRSSSGDSQPSRRASSHSGPWPGIRSATNTDLPPQPRHAEPGQLRQGPYARALPPFRHDGGKRHRAGAPLPGRGRGAGNLPRPRGHAGCRCRSRAARLPSGQTGSACGKRAVEPSHSGPFKLYAKDRAGIILHDVLFAPFFAGAAGTGQIWHWDHYVAPNNLWHHFARFAEVVKNLDPAAEDLTPGTITHDRLRIYTLRGRRTFLAWCRDTQNTWESELANATQPETLRNIEVDTGLAHSGICDPWSNEWRAARLSAGRIKLPEFSRSAVIAAGS